MKRTFLLLCCVVATAISSHAQRLLPRQTGVEITAGVPVIQNEKLIQPETFTANISFTRYLKAENYTFLSAVYERQNLPHGKSNVPLSDALLLAGYMHPLLSDGGKNAFVYAGCSALAGYEELNRGESVCARRCGATRPFAYSWGRRAASPCRAVPVGSPALCRRWPRAVPLRLGCVSLSTCHLGRFSHQPLTPMNHENEHP